MRAVDKSRSEQSGEQLGPALLWQILGHCAEERGGKDKGENNDSKLEDVGVEC